MLSSLSSRFFRFVTKESLQSKISHFQLPSPSIRTHSSFHLFHFSLQQKRKFNSSIFHSALQPKPKTPQFRNLLFLFICNKKEGKTMSSKANQVLDEVRGEEKLHPSSSTPKIRHPNSLLPSFTFRHLNALAVMVVLSASGMVSIEDIAFVFLSFFYTIFLFKFAFPDLTPSLKPPVFGSRITRLMFYYVPLTAFVGLFFPIAYILEGVFSGEKERIEAAAPHVFLLASQLFMEGVTFSNRFSLPIRAFVPICYNTRRIFAIVDWSRSEFGKVGEELGGGGWRLQVGKGLAIANLVLWSYNLFGFLLPVWLPIVFKGYYGFKLKD